MRLIEEIKENYNTVSIIGLAKNAGKTVTLNYLIEESFENNINIGITSTGRDGETTDVVTNTEKPMIFVEEGMIIATAASRLKISDAKLEILETTSCHTPMGEIIICKIKGSGSVQLAGPVNLKDTAIICSKLKSHGAEVVIIDGAVDRKAASSPLISDVCILSTGAVLSRDINKVVEKTAHAIKCYSLKEIEDIKLRGIVKKVKTTALINKDYEVYVPEIKTSINSGKIIRNYIDENTRYIFIRGAFTSSLAKELSDSKNFKKIKIIIENGTKIFIDPYIFNNLLKKGMKLEVLKKINVAAITVNPVSPYGYTFESSKLINEIKKSTKYDKVIDVISGGE
jgi:hypothetical protein